MNMMNYKLQNKKNLYWRDLWGIFLLLPIFLTGCKEEGRIDHIDSKSTAPAKVTDVEVYNTSGGAVLRYKVPADDNLLYVKAEYEIRPGIVRQTSASYYADSLILEGFGDTRTYNVNVYSVGKNAKASEPLIIQVNPTTAPVILATKQLNETFGGISVRIENPQRAALAIELMGDTAHLGYHSTLQTFYTSAEKATFAYRGLDTVSYDFSVYLRDRWDNISNTIEATLTPWFEEYVPKSTWREVNLPGDAYLPMQERNEYKIYNLWDEDRFSGNWVSYFSISYPYPQLITWDMGMMAILSRARVFHMPEGTGRILGMEAPRKIEIYGSVAPNPDGSLDESWIPLGKFEILPVSGQLPASAEDIAYMRNNGFDCDFEANDFAPNPFVPVRYIRFKTIETYNGPMSSGSTAFKEIDLFGSIVR